MAKRKVASRSKSSKDKPVVVKINKKIFTNLFRRFFAFVPIVLIGLGTIILVWGVYDFISSKINEEETQTETVIEDQDDEETNDNEEDVPTEETDENNDDNDEESDENVDIEEETGEILDEGIITEADASDSQDTENIAIISNNLSGEEKSKLNQERMVREGRWIATDYVYGDIDKGSYTVQRGDTLWELAEAVYGNGSMWKIILNANSDSVGFLPNGSQALIVSGQVLEIP